MVSIHVTSISKLSCLTGSSFLIRSFLIRRPLDNFGGSRNFRSNVRISGRTFKNRKTLKFIKTRHLKNSVVVGISGRTFKIQKNIKIQKKKKNGPSENFGHTPLNSYKIKIKSYKNHIKSYRNHMKS